MVDVHMEEWVKNEWRFQQEMFFKMGDRDFDKLNLEQLKEKIDIAFQICYDDYKKVSKHVKSKVQSLFANCSNDNTDYYFSCCFISCKLLDTKEFKYVVFRLKTNGDELFFDQDCRKYNSWSEFILNNKLPKCDLLYPENGKYTYAGQDYIDVIYDKSAAAKNKLRDTIRLISTTGSIIATTVLTFNPVNLPVLAGAGVLAATTGTYMVGSNIKELIDIKNHEVGSSLTNGKTPLILADIGLTALSTSALGVSSVLKSYALKTGRIFAEGTFACYMAGNVGKICRIASGSSVLLSFVNLINKAMRDNLTLDDLKELGKILFFSFNLIISESLLKMLFDDFATYSIEDVIDNVVTYKLRTFSNIKNVQIFDSVEQFQQLRAVLMPFISKLYPEIVVVFNSVDNIVDLTNQVMKNRINRMSYIYELYLELINLWAIVKESINKVTNEIKDKIDLDLFGDASKWLENNVSSNVNRNLSFEFQIRSIKYLLDVVKKSVKLYSVHCNDNLTVQKREKLLFLTVLKMIQKGSFVNYFHSACKLEWFCKCFDEVSAKMKDYYYYSCFKHLIIKNERSNKEYFFRHILNIPDSVSDHIFNESLKLLSDEYDIYNRKFERYYNENQADPLFSEIQNDENDKIFSFYVTNRSTSLKRDEYYEKIEEFIPILSLANRDCLKYMTFEIYFDALAIIKSLDNSVAFYFYTDLDIDHKILSGLIVFTKLT